MFKTALFDCAINEKGCSVERRMGHLPSFSVTTSGDLTASRVPNPRNLPTKAKKMLVPRGVGKLELTDT